ANRVRRAWTIAVSRGVCRTPGRGLRHRLARCNQQLGKRRRCLYAASARGGLMREIEPIAGDCVWHGCEMARSTRWRRRLSAVQLAEIDVALAAARGRGLGWDELTAADFPVPSFGPLADDIRGELEDGSGVVLLQGLDPGRYSLDDLKLLYAGL